MAWYWIVAIVIGSIAAGALAVLAWIGYTFRLKK
jgi:hypothetical protein